MANETPQIGRTNVIADVKSQQFQNTNIPVNENVIHGGPLFDEVHQEHMEIFIYPFVFLVIYMVVGFIGNSIVIYIFTVKWKLTKTTVFILTLAGVDLMSCLVNMPSEAAILWHPIDFDHDVMCKISRYTTFIASASSSFVLIAISIDRYLMVCRPFLGRELGVRYAKKTCIVALMLGIIATCPSLIFYGTYTYHIDKTDPDTGELVKIESKTCLIKNFYVEHYRLPAGFYFFLLGAHVIMFVILTMLYLLIGRSLYMSTSTDVPQEKRHSLKYFGLSMMSAFTGTVPNSPASEQRERCSLGSRSSKAVSLENIHHIQRFDQSPVFRNTPPVRVNSETAVSVFVTDEDKSDNSKPVKHSQEHVGMSVLNGNAHQDEVLKTIVENKETSDCDETNFVEVNQNNLFVDTGTDDSASEGSQSSPLKQKSKNNNLTLKIGRERWLSSNGRLSSGSTASHSCLTPVTPVTPDSVRGILYRSQSVESRAKLNRIISDELRRVEVKEFSLRRNTLIMRMVTIAFVVSFLPYLVIVTLRYSNPDIPNKLSKVEQILYHVFLRTYFINSMINPFIYGFMNTEFRAKLKELFCAFCTRHNIQLPIKV